MLLWSKLPWHSETNRSPEGMPPGRYVFGETETSLGLLGIHGLCIPWADAHVRTGQRNRQRWQDHLAYLAALPTCLNRQSCDLQALAGDFNQRIPRRRVPAHVNHALQDVLENRFNIVTAGAIAPIDRQTIDHVGLVDQLQANWIQSISNLDPQGQQLSDHFGLAACLQRAG